MPILLGGHCSNLPKDGGVFQDEEGYDFHWSSYAYPIPVNMDYALPDRLKHDVQQAADHWNELAGYSVFQVSEVGSGDPGILGLPVYGTISVAQAELGRGTRGDVLGQAEIHLMPRGRGAIHSVNMWVDYDTKASIYFEVALHEFGHSLGLRHDGDPNSIMFWKVQENQYVMPDDIARVQNFVR